MTLSSCREVVVSANFPISFNVTIFVSHNIDRPQSRLAARDIANVAGMGKSKLAVESCSPRTCTEYLPTYLPYSDIFAAMTGSKRLKLLPFKLHSGEGTVNQGIQHR